MGTAINYALSWDVNVTRDRIYGLAAGLREKLADIDGITVTDEGVEKCGIVTFMASQMTSTKIKEALATQGINVSASKGSGSLVSFQQRGLSELVRASLHYYNTREEIDYFAATLQKILRGAI